MTVKGIAAREAECSIDRCRSRASIDRLLSLPSHRRFASEATA